MIRSARRISPLFILSSLMIAALLAFAACSSATPTPAPAAPAMDQQAIADLQRSINDLATAQPEGLTAAQVQAIVDQAMMGAESGDALTAMQVQEIVGQAIGAMDTPEGLTAMEVQSIVGQAMGSAPEGLTAMQVQDIVSSAMAAAETPEGLTAMEVQDIVSTAIAEALPEEEKDTIVFADLNWGSAQIQSAIAQHIVKHGYGYPVAGEFGGTVPLFQGLLGGDIHVTMEIWLPNQNDVWLPALDEGKVIPVGNSLDEQWQSAFVIPTYLAEANPELRTVQDLRDHLDLFEKEGDKVILWTCPSEWACSRVNAGQVTNYGLDDVLVLKGAPGGGLAASLNGAYQKEEPWLGFMWFPALSSAVLDLTRLEEPACAVGQDSVDGCAYGAGPVRIAVHPTLVQRAPEVIELLRRWSFDEVVGEALNYQSQTDASYEEVATWFLSNYEDLWTTWVPQNVADRVKASLPAETS